MRIKIISKCIFLNHLSYSRLAPINLRHNLFKPQNNNSKSKTYVRTSWSWQPSQLGRIFSGFWRVSTKMFLLRNIYLIRSKAWLYKVRKGSILECAEENRWDRIQLRFAFNESATIWVLDSFSLKYFEIKN